MAQQKLVTVHLLKWCRWYDNQVGQNALNTKDKPVNKIIYADNTTNHLDGNFHGQRLNDVVLNYDAATSTVTATYAGKTWKATTDDLGIDKSQNIIS